MHSKAQIKDSIFDVSYFEFAHFALKLNVALKLNQKVLCVGFPIRNISDI